MVNDDGNLFTLRPLTYIHISAVIQNEITETFEQWEE